jgi:hypothetical protein
VAGQPEPPPRTGQLLRVAPVGAADSPVAVVAVVAVALRPPLRVLLRARAATAGPAATAPSSSRRSCD